MSVPEKWQKVAKSAIFLIDCYNITLTDFLHMALIIGRNCGFNGPSSFYNGRVAMAKGRLYQATVLY